MRTMCSDPIKTWKIYICRPQCKHVYVHVKVYLCILSQYCVRKAGKCYTLISFLVLHANFLFSYHAPKLIRQVSMAKSTVIFFCGFFLSSFSIECISKFLPCRFMNSTWKLQVLLLSLLLLLQQRFSSFFFFLFFSTIKYISMNVIPGYFSLPDKYKKKMAGVREKNTLSLHIIWTLSRQINNCLAHSYLLSFTIIYFIFPFLLLFSYWLNS